LPLSWVVSPKETLAVASTAAANWPRAAFEPLFLAIDPRLRFDTSRSGISKMRVLGIVALALTTALTVPAHARYVYRAPPIHRAPVYHPRPIMGHPVGRPIMGHRGGGRRPIQGPHHHNIHHGMHGHFHHGHWIANPNDPPYAGDDYDSGDAQNTSASSSDPVSSPSANSTGSFYGAAAAAAYSDGAGNGLASGGTATGGNQAEADALALQTCENHGGGGYCAIVGRFRNGTCGYVSVGSLGNDQLPIGHFSSWGYGTTPQVAFAQCAKNLVGCQQPFGSCSTSR
jgi:hypothetical protein